MRMRRVAMALRAIAALIMLHVWPTSTRLSGSLAGEPCNGGNTCVGPQTITRDARRRLLLAGWAEATAVRPPQFVELVPAAGLSGSGQGDPEPHKRVFSHEACADSPEWRFIWPTSLTEGFNCEDYAAGAINHAYCDDLGYDFDKGEWVTARQACPVACAVCCDIAPHCEQAADPAGCREGCMAARNVTVDGRSTMLVDPFEKYLAHVGTDVLAMYQQHKRGVDTALTVNQTVHQVVPFGGGQFMDEKEFRFFSSTPLSKIRYTTDGTKPSSTVGTMAAKVKLVQSSDFKAISYMPQETRLTLAASNISSVPITIKASPPSVNVLECRLPDDSILRFNASFEYNRQVCTQVKVEIKARASLGALGNETRLRYVVNQPDPGASNPQGQRRAVITLVSTTVDHDDDNQTAGAGELMVSGATRLSARAWRTGTLPSDVVMSEEIVLGVGDVRSLGWMGTVGHWKFTRSQLVGIFRRPLNRDDGCKERLPTYISPSSIQDTSQLGPAELRGPQCKGGVWDLDYALSPNLIWFLDTATEAVEDTEAAMNASTAMGVVGGADDLLGLRFDSLNSGLYVVDDVSGAVARGNFPLETLSVEAVLSIDSDVRIALGGVVAARIDGAEVGGFRYGKGWSVSYSVDIFDDTITFIFALAVAAAEVQPGFGGLQDVKAEVARSLLPRRHPFHLVCTYDGKYASIYLDGVRLVHQHVCQDERCGNIMYPQDEDSLYTGGRRAGMTLGVLDSLESGRIASHQGSLRLVRVFKNVLSEEQIKAASDRMQLWRLAEVACSPGQYGPYEGLEPCVPCASGKISVNLQSAECEDCARGFYAPVQGGVECFLCTPGFETLGAGSSFCTNDRCLLGSHDCDPLATCTSLNTTDADAEEGFTCVCPPGFHGSGKAGDCQTLCGDGFVAGAEECDDGSTNVGDGCSDSCRIENHFQCSPAGTGSTCACTGPPEVCCVAEYGLCLRGLSSSRSGSVSQVTSRLQSTAACLENFAGCQKAASQATGSALVAPDSPLFRSGNATTYGLSRDEDPSLVSAVPAACDAAQQRRCQLLHEHCAVSPTPTETCLQLEAACLMAVQCP